MIDKELLADYQAKAVRNALPGFSSWLTKHGLGMMPLFQMNQQQIEATLGKFMQMYEREMGKILDPENVQEPPL